MSILYHQIIFQPHVSVPSRFAFEGIGQLLEHLLISEAKCIRLANANGIRKMTRNILALQQSIKTLTSNTRGADFDRAKKYYNLFFMTPTVCALCGGVRVGLCVLIWHVGIGREHQSQARVRV